MAISNFVRSHRSSCNFKVEAPVQPAAGSYCQPLLTIEDFFRAAF